MKSPARISPYGPEIYNAKNIFEQEISKVFKINWIFAGFKCDLSKNNDYIAIQVADRSIVIQNFDGELRAYHNVCTHRHALIRNQPCGNGPLRCSYHGWTYNRDGIPAGIPANKQEFEFEAQEKVHELALERFEVDTCGHFVFVRLSHEGPSLVEYLGGMYEILSRMEPYFDRPFEVQDQNWEANWKIGVENTLESYHVEAVHSASIGMMLVPDGRISFCEKHSMIRHSMVEKSHQWWRKMVKATGIRPVPEQEHYNHFHIYPNLCIGFTYGSLLSVQTFHPVSEDKLKLTYRLFLPVSEKTETSESMLEILSDHLREFNEQILIEDRMPVELAHAGSKQMVAPPVHSISEQRISHFLDNLFEEIQE